MIEVARYIERLLLQNDCVIIPKLGGFIAQNCEACYVKEENIFLPPYRSVSFNPRLTMNDGLFITEVAMRNRISYTDAADAVTQEVNLIKHTITKKGKYSVPGVGTISMANGVYEFSPIVCGIDSPEHYALDSLSVQRLEKQTKTQHVLTVETKNTDIVTLRIKKNVVNYIAAVAVAVVFFFICISPLHNAIESVPAEASALQNVWTFITQGNITSHNTHSPANISASVSTITSKGKKVVENTKTEVGEAQNKNKETTTQTQASKPYTIILASAIPEEGAKKMVLELKKEGFSEASVIHDRNMIRVVYGHYANSAEAQHALCEGKTQNPKFNNAWILAL